MAARYGRLLGVLLQNSRRISFINRRELGRCDRFSCFGAARSYSSAQPAPQKETVAIHFVLPDGQRKTAKAKLGDSLLDVVLDNNLDIDGYGACEGTLACSTCHIIFKEENFKQISVKATDEELDMLDLAYGLTDMSRLGCQIVVTKEMEGWEVMVPAGFADARS